MKKLFFFLAVFFLCLACIRTGLGVEEELHFSVILDYLSDQEYGTTHIKETIERFSEISHEIEKNGFIEEDGSIKSDLTFQEQFEIFADQMFRVFKLIGNAVLFTIQIAELILTEIVYILQILFYLLFGVPF